jgi:hypothetical protein
MLFHGSTSFQIIVVHYLNRKIASNVSCTSLAADKPHQEISCRKSRLIGGACAEILITTCAPRVAESSAIDQLLYVYCNLSFYPSMLHSSSD